MASPITINNDHYYDANVIKSNIPTLFKKIKSLRSIIQKWSLNKEDYIYANYGKSKGYVLTENPKNSSKVLVKCEVVWSKTDKIKRVIIDNSNQEEKKPNKIEQSYDLNDYYNMEEYKKVDPALFWKCGKSTRKIIKKYGLKKKDCKLMLNGKESTIKCKQATLYVKKCIVDKLERKYKNKPDRIYLEDNKFYDIPMYGKREKNGIYFDISAVGKICGLKDLSSIAADDRNSYIYGYHYLSFISTSEISLPGKRYKINLLTYDGLIKILSSSRSGNRDKIDNIFKNIIDGGFIATMGTNEDKEDLIDDYIGKDIRYIRYIMKINRNDPMPCVYLFSLGSDPKYTKEGEIILKYGRTKDFCQRIYQHQRCFPEIQLLRYFYINNIVLARTETAIKHHMLDNYKQVRGMYNEKGNQYSELFIIKSNERKSVINNIANIVENYRDTYIAIKK